MLHVLCSMINAMKGFIQFIRERGVIGFAIGFILGGAVSKMVASFVTDVVNPLIGLVFGNVAGLSEMTIGTVRLGSFVSSMIDFLILAAVVYFVFKGLGLEKLDVKKDA